MKGNTSALVQALEKCNEDIMKTKLQISNEKYIDQ